LLDPNTLQTAELNSKVYWRSPFTSIAQAKDLVEFIIMDTDPVRHQGKWLLAEVTVARSNDLGTTYFARTHIGQYLHPGDTVLGYMLTGTNWNNDQFAEIEASHTYGSTIPDVVLVKKHNPNRRKNRKRNWKLKRVAKDEGDLLPKKSDQARIDEEYELFLRDVEEDEELRATMALYKNANKDAMSVADSEMDESGDEGPKINMDELLDDFEDLDIQEPGGGTNGGGQA
jgi:nonsense-mediated mRNA decay protein 3